MTYHIQVFGCSANIADSERIAGYYQKRGWKKAVSIKTADVVVIVTCMIRQSAEDRVVGLIRNLRKEKLKGRNVRIIITGCMVGMAVRDTTGTMMKNLHTRFPDVDQFIPIEEIGFEHEQIRNRSNHAFVLISNGCNNFCSYCVVPFARGKEVSRPFDDIVRECNTLLSKGYTDITLVGQNVNSYGGDILQKSSASRRIKSQKLKVNEVKKITYVKHLGKMRIPTLFPSLLSKISQLNGVTGIDFISSNPWDFSDELIDVIAENKNIKRTIHLPVQSGDTGILKRMNRWYTPKEYLALVKKILKKIPNASFSTDIIVGFPGESEKAFQHTVALCKSVGFTKAYISIYSDRPMTLAHKTMLDDIPFKEKKRRWEVLDEIINKTNLRNGTYI